MSSFNMIEHINLVNNLSISPIPLEFNDAMTTTKILAEFQAKLNAIIDFRNSAVTDSNHYTDIQITRLDALIHDLNLALTNGTIIPDKSISVGKMTETFISDINKIVVDDVHKIAKVVSFGINSEGYFFADIPDSWNEVIFSTDTEGRLNLKY